MPELYIDRPHWSVGMIDHTSEEQEVSAHIEYGPVSFWWSWCECGERHWRLLIDLPAPAHKCRRIHVQWFSGDRVKFFFDNFNKPAPGGTRT